MSTQGGTLRLFVDEATIHVRGGRGGDGCVSFRREKYVPRGGPDGGDGGNGGSVFLVAQPELDTLLDLAGRHHWHAQNGQPGSGANRAGKRGANLEVPVPPGTLIYDLDADRLLKDLTRPGERVRVAAGGRGGRGNAFFANSVNQAPRNADPGGKGQERRLRLELKLIADVGLVGLPNAGKSTLLSRVTKARPKIAAYPFTTTEPQLGIAELSDFRRLVLADIPGLIAGAHEGVGLGDAFLRHIERTRVIVHLIDLTPPEGGQSPIEAYHVIRRELEKYSAALAARREIIVGNKLDLTGADEALITLRGALPGSVLAISGVSGVGLRELLETIWTAVDEARNAEPSGGVQEIDFGDIPDDDALATNDAPGPLA
ncbi:MAG: GTPase ObgE [Phycisphaerae bacterium]